MKEYMPEVSFERSMNHNYMILSKCSFFGENENKGNDYRTKMLLGNRIPGLLPITHRLVNGESRYYYEINSLQSLDRLYDKAEIRYDELRRLLSGCVNLFDKLEEYLLDGTQIIMKPELIYINVEKMEPYFVCYPDYEEDVKLSFMEFIDGLLMKIDHTDERAVMLGYQIYRYTRNPNYVMSEIGNMMGYVSVKMVQEESGYMQNDISCSKNDSEEALGYSKYSNQAHPMANQENLTEHISESEHDKPNGRVRGISDLIGGVFCIFVSLCAGGILLGARIIHAFEIDKNNELYLYGALGMALVAAVLFFVCYVKKRQQDKDEIPIEDNKDSGDAQYYTSVFEESKECSNHFSQPQNYQNNIGTITQPSSYLQNTKTLNQSPNYLENAEKTNNIIDIQNKLQSVDENINFFQQSDNSDETVYLGNEVIEERTLCGYVNGEKVRIPLNRLPMTIGTLASVSDIVINDTFVSKMHARFEEHNGRVYLCDLNSTNGTMQNGVLLGINQSVLLEHGDRLKFGRACFTYC